jgi:hypothetical protein
MTLFKCLLPWRWRQYVPQNHCDYQTTAWCHNVDNYNINIHCRENLRYCKQKSSFSLQTRSWDVISVTECSEVCERKLKKRKGGKMEVKKISIATWLLHKMIVIHDNIRHSVLQICSQVFYLPNCILDRKLNIIKMLKCGITGE